MPRRHTRIFSAAASRRRAGQHFYWIGAAITAVALASSVAIVSPAAAAPAAGNITILSAGPDSGGDPYNLTVTANDGNGVQIQTMTAHVSNSTGPVVSATMTYNAGLSNGTSDQVWVAVPPIAESALPAGTYTVTVDASDSIEPPDSGLAAPGSFSFAYTTSSLTVTPAPPAVTQGSQKVTFTGTLTGTAPGGTAVGIANVPVNLSGAASNPVATTDSNGNFSYQATGVTPGTYSFNVAATSTYPAATASAPVTAQQAATSMTVAASPATVTEGKQAVTFSGSVSVTPPPPATQTAVGIGSGVPVYLNGSSTAVTQTTDANGDFSYSATGVQPGTYTFSVNQSTQNLYSSATATASVSAQPAPTTITLTPSPAVVTFGSPNATFSGTVTALPQGSSTAVAVPNAPVYLNGSASPVATTDSSGHFSYTATGITQDTTETFSVPASPAGLYSESSDPVPVNVDPGTAAMTVSANPPDIDLATSKVTFAGTVSVTPFGSTTAQGAGSGIPVYLSVSGGAATQVAQTNDANGDFSYTATGIKKAADYDFSVQSATLSTAASKSVPIGQNQVQSTLAVTANPASVTEGAQTVTFSGTLTGVSPGGSTSVAIQSAPVDVSVDGGTPTQITTTDVNGDFAYTVKSISQKTAYAFSVGSTTTYTQATDDVAIPIDQARTRIGHVKLTPAHLKYGQNATLRATVQYLDGTTWTALPGVAVHLAEGKTRLQTVTTARGGAFSATLPSTHGPGWTATVNTGRLTLQTSAMGNLSIALPLTVKSFSARLGTDDKISATGCVEVTSPAGHAPQTSVTIQYSARGHGQWKRLGTLPLRSESRKFRSCPGADESYFSSALKAQLANAYYRAVFAATYSFQATASKVVHAWKYRTRVVSFRIRPHHMSFTSAVTITGRLQVFGKSWQAYPHQKVYIEYNDKGTKFSATLKITHTNSKGSFELQALGAKGNFVAITYAVYRGDARHLASSSPGIPVDNNNDNNGNSAALALAPPLSLPELLKLTDGPGLPVPLVTAFQPPGAFPLSDLVKRASGG